MSIDYGVYSEHYWVFDTYRNETLLRERNIHTCDLEQRLLSSCTITVGQSATLDPELTDCLTLTSSLVGCGDQRDEVLELGLESGSIGDLEKEEDFSLLGEANASQVLIMVGGKRLWSDAQDITLDV